VADGVGEGASTEARQAMTVTAVSSAGRGLRESRVAKEGRGVSSGGYAKSRKKFAMIIKKDVQGWHGSATRMGSSDRTHATVRARQGPTPTNLSSRRPNPTSERTNSSPNQRRIPPCTPPTTYVPPLVGIAAQTAE
jgi:hypothetical protein